MMRKLVSAVEAESKQTDGVVQPGDRIRTAFTFTGSARPPSRSRNGSTSCRRHRRVMAGEACGGRRCLVRR